MILSRDADFVCRARAACGDAIDAVAAPSGYEAAAEILDVGAAVLVVDFRALGKAHVRLLDVARGCGIEMLGVGPLSAGVTAANLNRMRLATEEDLAAAMASVLPRQTKPGAPAGPRPAAERRAHRAERAARKKARRVPQRGGAEEEFGEIDAGSFTPPAPTFRVETQDEEPVDRMEGEYSSTEENGAKRQAASKEQTASQDAAGDASRVAGHAPLPEPASTGAPRALLTPEELAALLEDRP